MAQAIRQKKEEELNIQQHISAFLVKNRSLIIGGIVAIFVIIGALVAITIVSDNKRDAAYSKIDTLVEQWNEAKNASDTSALATAEDTIIADLTKIADGNGRTFAGARAGLALAEIYFSRKDWQNAETWYLAVEKASPESYTAGLALFNASVCADESGNADNALSYLEKAIALESFPMKTRALFNIGRIEEDRNQNDKAIAAYEKLTGDYAEDEWTLLAKSRLIALTLK